MISLVSASLEYAEDQLAAVGIGREVSGEGIIVVVTKADGEVDASKSEKG